VPDAHDYRFDFCDGYRKSRWNKIMVERLLNAVEQELGQSDSPREWLRVTLNEQLNRIRETWYLAQPKGNETLGEAIARYNQRHEDALERAGNNSRMGRKLKDRVVFVKMVIGIKESTKAKDLESWKRLLKMLLYLGNAGMSSEEVVEEREANGYKTYFVVKVCVWRADDVTEYLEMRHSAVSTSPAPKGLPKCLYNAKWLEDESKKSPVFYEDLEVSEASFALLQKAAEMCVRSAVVGSTISGCTCDAHGPSSSDWEEIFLTYQHQASSTFTGHVRLGDSILGSLDGDPKLLMKLPSREMAPTIAFNAWDANFVQTTWISPETPYFVFVPLHNPFHGPLFECLRTPRDGFPLITDGTGWMLDLPLQESWGKLESGLRHLLRAMYKVFGSNPSVGMIDFLPRYFAWPKRFGYAQTYRNRESAKIVAERTRNSFLPLMSTITMMFLIFEGQGWSSWRDRVLETSGLHSAWFAEVESSAVGDLKLPRLEWLVNLVCSLNLSIPLYFYWGKITNEPEYCMPSYLRDKCFYPDTTEISHLKSLPGQVTYSPWSCSRGPDSSVRIWQPDHKTHPSSLPTTQRIVSDSAPHPASFTADTMPQQQNIARTEAPAHTSHASAETQSYPQPEKNSGQLYGEDIHRFLARQKAHNAQIEAKEKPKSKQERLQREAHAAKGSPPGKKGARVFVWEAEDNYLIRRAINRVDAADRWDEFTDNQRFYNSFRNEWDLCAALAPNEEPEGYDSDEDDRGPGLEAPLLPGVPDDFMPEEEIGDLPTASDILRPRTPEQRPHADPRTHPQRQALQDSPIGPIPERDDAECGEVDDDFEPGEVDDWTPPLYDPYHDMSVIPSMRFGFTSSVSPPNHPKAFNNKLCLKTLGDEQWPDLQKSQYNGLPSFFAYLQAAKSLNDLPADLLDLRQAISDISNLSNWAIAVSQERLNGELFYILRPKDLHTRDHVDHIVLLKSAAATLQVLRMGWGPDPEDIILNLLSYGIEFRICVRRWASPHHQPWWMGRYGHQHTGLGYRRLCNDFLLSPRGRAALFAGGIVGRLARESFVVVKEACRGPSSEISYTGLQLWDGKSATSYWDDALTEEDVDLICGVYEIGTGVKRTEEMQTTKLSWWPKPLAFSHSGLNVGWWSPDCEHWYQQRLAVIQSGTAKLHTQAEWKNIIRYYQKSREIGTKNELVAAEFLSVNLT
ncbi:hypothetical protein R3P38DRAFT_2505225, partial [Favolaschia claudopus]